MSEKIVAESANTSIPKVPKALDIDELKEKLGTDVKVSNRKLEDLGRMSEKIYTFINRKYAELVEAVPVLLPDFDMLREYLPPESQEYKTLDLVSEQVVKEIVALDSIDPIKEDPDHYLGTITNQLYGAAFLALGELEDGTIPAVGVEQGEAIQSFESFIVKCAEYIAKLEQLRMRMGRLKKMMLEKKKKADSQQPYLSWEVPISTDDKAKEKDEQK